MGPAISIGLIPPKDGNPDLGTLRAKLRERSRRRNVSDDSDYFAALRKAERLAERQRDFLTRTDGGVHADETATRLVSLGVSRVEERKRFLARKEKLILARMGVSVLGLAGVAAAVWVLALNGDPAAALHTVGI
jgi:hypothetical protein